MSASQEKKRRKQDTTAVSKREQREAEMKKAKKLNRRIALITTAVLVVFIAVVVVFSSAWFYRAAKAVKVADTTYSVADYNFYYYTKVYQHYNNVYEQYGDYASYFLPQEGKSLSSQKYSEDQTWEEYFREQADEYLKDITVMYNAGKAAGFTLPTEAEKELEETIEIAQSNAAKTKMSFNKYLESQYGKGVNEKIYRTHLERVYLATHYSESVYNGYTYDTESIRAKYAENKDNYDTYTLNTYKVVPAKTENDDEKAAALAKAKENADTFKQNVLNGSAFVKEAYALAADDEKDNYKEDDAARSTVSGSNLSKDYAEWVKDAARKEGDIEVFETSDETGCYVVEFISRDDNNYKTVNVRHLLVRPEEVSKDDYDTDAEYEKAVDEADAAAKKQAEDYLAEWQEDPTEENFTKLADKNSEDTGTGGEVLEKVYKGQMVAGFNEWCFDSARKPGDCEIVSSTYGYHLIYFVGENDTPYCDDMAETALRNDDFAAWEEDLLADTKFSRRTFYGLVG